MTHTTTASTTTTKSPGPSNKREPQHPATAAADEEEHHLDMTDSTHPDTYSVMSISATTTTTSSAASASASLPSTVLQIIEKVEEELVRIDAAIAMYETLVTQTHSMKDNHLALAQARGENGNTTGADLSLRKVHAANDKLERLQEALQFLQDTKLSANKFFERCSSTGSCLAQHKKEDVAVLCSMLRRQCKEICAAVSKAQTILRRKQKQQEKEQQQQQSPAKSERSSTKKTLSNREELAEKLQPMFFL